LTITLQALSEKLNLNPNDEYFSQFTRENSEEIHEIDNAVNQMKLNQTMQSSQKSLKDGKSKITKSINTQAVQ
jgi:hypothetical protein